MSTSPRITFYTTIPKVWHREDTDRAVDDIIRHGVREIDFNFLKDKKFNRIFIKCNPTVPEVKEIISKIRSEEKGRARFDYNFGGVFRGYLLLSIYDPSRKTQRPKTQRPIKSSTHQEITDLRADLLNSIKANQALEKENQELRKQLEELRTRMSATTELPTIAPTSPGYCPTSPKSSDE